MYIFIDITVPNQYIFRRTYICIKNIYHITIYVYIHVVQRVNIFHSLITLQIVNKSGEVYKIFIVLPVSKVKFYRLNRIYEHIM